VGLTTAHTVVFPGEGHSVLFGGVSPCPAEIMHLFLNEPTAEPDAACIAQDDAPALFGG
jgi:hypothetical protein